MRDREAPRARRRSEMMRGKPVSEGDVTAWFEQNGPGGPMQIALAIDRPYMTVFWCLRRMRRDGLAMVVKPARGPHPAVWAITRKEIPLNTTSVTGLVREAIRNQHPLATVWAQPTRETA